MDENNTMHFSCEPMGDYSPSNGQGAPSGDPKKPEKKGKITGKIVAMLLVVALLGSVGGSALTAAINSIHSDDKEAVQATSSDATDASEEDGTNYQLVSHALPDELPTNDTGKSLTESQVYALAVNSVVGITTEATTNVFGQQAVSANAGTGFILTEDGYIMTNYHVIEDAYSGGYDVSVMLHDGTTYLAQIVGFERNNDIAILKIDATGLSAATLGSSSDLSVGDTVYAVGNPLGELAYSMTSGIVSATDRVISTDVSTNVNMFQFDAAVNEGNSGGPLYDAYGHVIGVVTAKTGDSASTAGTEGLNFAIPIDDAARIANNIIERAETGSSETLGNAYLGITAQDIDRQFQQYYGFPAGAFVYSVEEGGAAEAAGLKVGDVITELDGFAISGRDDLANELSFHSAGETVDMTVYRSGEYITLTVTFGERPAEEADAQTTPTESSGYYNDYDFGWGNLIG